MRTDPKEPECQKGTTFTDFQRCYLLARDVSLMLDSQQRIESVMQTVTKPITGMPGCPKMYHDDALVSAIQSLQSIMDEYKPIVNEYVLLAAQIKNASDSIQDGLQRVVVRLHYIDGMSWPEIARKVGRAQSWVRELRWRGLKSIGLDPSEDD